MRRKCGRSAAPWFLAAAVAARTAHVCDAAEESEPNDSIEVSLQLNCSAWAGPSRGCGSQDWWGQESISQSECQEWCTNQVFTDSQAHGDPSPSRLSSTAAGCCDWMQVAGDANGFCRFASDPLVNDAPKSSRSLFAIWATPCTPPRATLPPAAGHGGHHAAVAVPIRDNTMAAAGARCAQGFCEDPGNCPQCAAGLTCAVAFCGSGTCFGTCTPPQHKQPYSNPPTATPKQNCNEMMGIVCTSGLDCVSTMGPWVADGGGICEPHCPRYDVKLPHGAGTAYGVRDPWGNCIPPSCSMWFDGCNTCTVENGRTSGCTANVCYELTVPGQPAAQAIAGCRDPVPEPKGPIRCPDGWPLGPGRFIRPVKGGISRLTIPFGTAGKKTFPVQSPDTEECVPFSANGEICTPSLPFSAYDAEGDPVPQYDERLCHPLSECHVQAFSGHSSLLSVGHCRPSCESTGYAPLDSSIVRRPGSALPGTVQNSFRSSHRDRWGNCIPPQCDYWFDGCGSCKPETCALEAGCSNPSEFVGCREGPVDVLPQFCTGSCTRECAEHLPSMVKDCAEFFSSAVEHDTVNNVMDRAKRMATECGDSEPGGGQVPGFDACPNCDAECMDASEACHSGACGDSHDNDRDGFVDCSDTDCIGQCLPRELPGSHMPASFAGVEHHCDKHLEWTGDPKRLGWKGTLRFLPTSMMAAQCPAESDCASSLTAEYHKCAVILPYVLGMTDVLAHESHLSPLHAEFTWRPDFESTLFLMLSCNGGDGGDGPERRRPSGTDDGGGGNPGGGSTTAGGKPDGLRYLLLISVCAAVIGFGALVRQPRHPVPDLGKQAAGAKRRKVDRSVPPTSFHPSAHRICPHTSIPALASPSAPHNSGAWAVATLAGQQGPETTVGGPLGGPSVGADADFGGGGGGHINDIGVPDDLVAMNFVSSFEDEWSVSYLPPESSSDSGSDESNPLMFDVGLDLDTMMALEDVSIHQQMTGSASEVDYRTLQDGTSVMQRPACPPGDSPLSLDPTEQWITGTGLYSSSDFPVGVARPVPIVTTSHGSHGGPSISPPPDMTPSYMRSYPPPDMAPSYMRSYPPSDMAPSYMAPAPSYMAPVVMSQPQVSMTRCAPVSRPPVISQFPAAAKPTNPRPSRPRINVIVDENAPNGRKFKCPLPGCKYAATRRRYVGEHLKTHETAANTKNFKCPVEGCEYKATRRRYVGEHMRTHTGEKPHKCTHPGCEYAATGSGHLIRHMSVHSGNKRHKCKVPGCNYASPQSTHLTEHMRTHSGDKPFKCTVGDCEHAFTRSWHVARHIKLKHGNVAGAAVAALPQPAVVPAVSESPSPPPIPRSCTPVSTLPGYGWPPTIPGIKKEP